VEVLRGAISEIEDYARVDLLTDSPDFIQGAAVADVTHLLAELIENAVLYSPPSARVQVRGSRAANGYAVEVEDRGLGIRAQDRAVLNERLARPPEFDIADSDQLGLFVVARLALRQDIRVSLRESGYGGTTAIVLLPGPLVVAEDEAATAAPRNPAPIGGAQTGGAPTGSGVTGGGLAGAGFTGGGLTGDESAPVLRRQMPALPGVGAAAEPGVRTMPFPGDRSQFGSGADGDRSQFGSGASGDGTSGSGASPASQGHEPSAYPRRTPGASGARSAFAGQPPAFKDSSRTAADHGTDRPSGTTESGLPRRDRGANVAPQLRDSPRLQPRGPLSDRSPEQARALLSSIQRGLRTGRNATVGNNPNNPNNPNNTNRGTTGEDQR
jgi:anti-sigma regulatory factor (Ser/Thr protein kinase)